MYAPRSVRSSKGHARDDKYDRTDRGAYMRESYEDFHGPRLLVLMRQIHRVWGPAFEILGPSIKAAGVEWEHSEPPSDDDLARANDQLKDHRVLTWALEVI